MIKAEKLGNEVFLLENNDDFNELISIFNKLPAGTSVGLDTETTGLDYIKDKIVGYCLAVKSGNLYKGWYLPIRHNAYPDNLNLERTTKFIQWVLRKFQTVLFNRAFDFFMMEADGIVIDSRCRSHDVQIMVWEATSERMPSLKGSYKKFCNKEVPTLIQTLLKSKSIDELETDYNFGNTDPRTSYTYGAYDPIATLELGETVSRKCPYIKKIYPLDNKVSEVVRNQSKIDVVIDYEEVARFSDTIAIKIRELKAEIYNYVGYQFNLNSNREKAEALSRFVTLTEKTNSGAFSVKAEVLSRLGHPLAIMLLKYAELNKFVSSYITPLANSKGLSTKFNWNLVSAPTGRLACGGAGKNSYFIHYNLQSVPKEREVLYVHPHPVIGLHLTTDPKEALGECETKSGFRRTFSAPPGYVFMSFDYSQEELRLTANVAKEKVWSDAFNNGEDLHMKVAKLAFGQETKEARGHAKAVTFGLLYGMSTHSLAKRLEVSSVRAQEIVDKYFSALTALKKWMNFQKMEARKRLMTFTYYGRPRNLEPYYNTSDPSKFAFADRSAVNTVIQGAGADILRIKLCAIDKFSKDNPDFSENVIVPFSVYDEINFYVKESYVEKAYDIIPKLMYEMHDDWACPVIVEGGIGTSWGTILDQPVLRGNKIINAKGIKWYE